MCTGVYIVQCVFLTNHVQDAFAMWVIKMSNTVYIMGLNENPQDKFS